MGSSRVISLIRSRMKGRYLHSGQRQRRPIRCLVAPLFLLSIYFSAERPLSNGRSLNVAKSETTHSLFEPPFPPRSCCWKTHLLRSLCQGEAGPDGCDVVDEDTQALKTLAPSSLHSSAFIHHSPLLPSDSRKSIKSRFSLSIYNQPADRPTLWGKSRTQSSTGRRLIPNSLR